MKFIKKFSQISIDDINLVGGKNASLGQMINQLSDTMINIPNGFATTAASYWYFIKSNNLESNLKKLVSEIKNHQDIKTLTTISNKIRKLIEQASIPEDLKQEISLAYQELSQQYKTDTCSVALRSSATAEDLPNASFAGQQDSFLNIEGIENILSTYKKCISSLFTPRAIAYRIEQGFDHFDVALSVGIQKMVDAKAAGVAFTLDTETGFKNVVMINSAWGLGETVVKGEVNPDSYYIFKPTLQTDHNALIRKQLGDKKKKLIYSDDQNKPTKLIATTKLELDNFSLSDETALELARQSIIIEKHYNKPMDIEWAIDSDDNQLYIVQARPETIHSQKDPLETFLLRYSLQKDSNTLKDKIIIEGKSIGQAIVSGKARVINNVDQIVDVQENEILITNMTDPDWVPIMKKAAGIITNIGGRTCHAAIVSRELGIPAIVGTHHATETIKTGDLITLDCSQGQVGIIYKGKIPFEVHKLNFDTIKKPPYKVLLNISDPTRALTSSFLPVDGVGLARIEFIFANSIKIHPMALLFPDRVTDKKDKEMIKKTIRGYSSGTDYFINILAQEVATIAAAFHPRPVVVRFSDLKSNEYRNLIAGHYFEPEEENPMLGLRGASRYYSDLYEPAFRMECQAILKILSTMGLDNIKLLIPFVRTLDEATQVLSILKEEGLQSNKKLDILMMCEIPSNVVLIQEFAALFDGFSIGSNDLTQFTLAVDRDSALVAPLFNELDPAVIKMLELAISGSHQAKKAIGICGQAPSDFPEMRQFLLDHKIDSISLNSESVITLLLT